MNIIQSLQTTLYRWLMLLSDGEAQAVADEIHTELHDSGFYTHPVRVPQEKEGA